ncbi:MBL fold metallo-hydrolase [Intrasporangium sp. DVR]|uniref:MBL fold metallo-hydrolase n=1 Tax=Intrasporangium sp. DVR TaxID=3127867 RepID=UPI00313A587F
MTGSPGTETTGRDGRGDDYTGHVVPDGPVAVRELRDLTIRKLAVSEMSNNVYLLTCRATGSQLLIDAADDAHRILEVVGSGGTGLEAVATTHRHWDHVRALAEVVAATGARTIAGEEDADDLPVPVAQRVGQGDVVRFGQIALDILHLRGHTPGSIALAYSDPAGSTHLFTGDSLFPGGAGRTTSPVDFASLMGDLEARVFDRYDDATWFYPGHGDDSTLGAERPHLDDWRRRGW